MTKKFQKKFCKFKREVKCQLENRLFQRRRKHVKVKVNTQKPEAKAAALMVQQKQKPTRRNTEVKENESNKQLPTRTYNGSNE